MGNANEFHIVCAGAAGLDIANQQFLCGERFCAIFLKSLATKPKGGYYI